MSQEITIQELTITEIIRKNKILEAYYSYWNEDVPIKPHFELKNINNILEDAAEIASRIRNHVDTEINKEVIFTLRTNDGTANRYLFHTENPNDDEGKFLRGLVVATLSSVDDQLESGVSIELIELFVNAFLEYKKSILEDGKLRQSFDSYTKENLFAILKETNALAESVFNLPADASDRDHNEEKIFLKSMIKLLENNYLHLLRYYRNSKFNHAIESPIASDTDDLGASADDDTQKYVTPTSSSPSLNTEESNNSRELTDSSQPPETVENNENNNAHNDDNNTENNTEKNIENNNENNEENVIEEGINEEAKCEDTTSEQKNENVDMRSSGFIKIAKIETDIENTVKELVELRQSITDLKVDYDDPRTSLHNVEELLRKCLYWGEALMKDLLTLDSMSSDSPQANEIRPIRKKQVVQIQKLMDDLEVLKTPLRTHQTALTKIVHVLDEEENRKKKEQEDALKSQQQQQHQPPRSSTSSSVPSSQAKRQRNQRKEDPLSFLPEQLKNLFNLSSYDNDDEKEGESTENPLQSAAKQFADLFNQPKQSSKPHDQSPPQSNIHRDQHQLHEDNEAKSTPPLRDDLLRFENNDEDLPIDEGEGEGEGEYDEYDEDLELYLSLLRQWKLLKFEPHFETERQRGRVVITAQLPNMKEDDFKIQINERDSSLTISACRLPSRDEFEYIKANLLRRARVTSPNELMKILFRYGIHRYGTFSSSFVLPRNTVYSKIAAKYEFGSLTIIAPFRTTQQQSRSIPISREGNFSPYTQDDYNPYRTNRNNYAPTDFYSPNFFF